MASNGNGERVSSKMARVYCIDPDIPDLEDSQLQALHRFKVRFSQAFDEVEAKVDPKIVLALMQVHLAKINADLHVPYKAAAGEGKPAAAAPA
jgi:hypothetical protein